MENQTKYLSLAWFKSKLDKAVETVAEKVITKKIEGLVEELSKENVFEEVPYHSSIGVNNTLTVVLKNGQVLTKSGVETEDLAKCKTEDDVIKLMSTKEAVEEKQKFEEVKKEVELIQSNFDILVETEDFEVIDGSVYLKGVNRSVPRLLVKRFAELINNAKSGYLNPYSFLENNIDYQSLIRFWKKCCLNPNAQSAEDLYEFLENHNMKIDQHGNFYAYRRVQTVEGEKTELVDFISNAYNKIKAVWKKNPVNYCILEEDGEYRIGNINSKDDGRAVSLGNLKDLYLDLPNMKENRYTSAHTGREDYRVGNVISMPRNEGDDDNGRNCSMGFHAASKKYDYSGFGDQDILVIINPMDVLAVPVGEVGKLRTCRWYFAMTLEENERFILDEDDFDVTYLGDVFEEKCLEDLEEHVKRGFTEEVKRHTFTIPNISAKEISNICKSLAEIQEELKARVVTV